MKMRWIVKGVLSFALLSGVALAAQGCNSAAVGYCNTACTCEGCDDQGRQNCIDYIENSRAVAVEAGCVPRFDEAVACLTEQSCKDAKIDESGCAVEVGSLNGCADAYYQTYCAIYVEHFSARHAECGIPQENPTPPASCSPSQGRRDYCLDGCLAKMDCGCEKDPIPEECIAKQEPYNSCVNNCYKQ